MKIDYPKLRAYIFAQNFQPVLFIIRWSPAAMQDQHRCTNWVTEFDSIKRETGFYFDHCCLWAIRNLRYHPSFLRFIILENWDLNLGSLKTWSRWRVVRRRYHASTNTWLSITSHTWHISARLGNLFGGGADLGGGCCLTKLNYKKLIVRFVAELLLPANMINNHLRL